MIDPDNKKVIEGVRVIVFNATFNNISVISWQSVLLVAETGVPGENHWPIITEVMSSNPAQTGCTRYNIM